MATLEQKKLYFHNAWKICDNPSSLDAMVTIMRSLGVNVTNNFTITMNNITSSNSLEQHSEHEPNSEQEEHREQEDSDANTEQQTTTQPADESTTYHAKRRKPHCQGNNFRQSNYARILPQCVSHIQFETSISPFNIQNRFKSPLTWTYFQTLSFIKDILFGGYGQWNAIQAYLERQRGKPHLFQDMQFDDAGNCDRFDDICMEDTHDVLADQYYLARRRRRRLE
ncbi:hypothetical protein G6F42_020726 [Rhizopus arrhizus]|nr:hypothetical protein G6F42_020726 [Rhizopus arrhizus]